MIKLRSEGLFQWLANGERGLSSETIVDELTDVSCIRRDRRSHPYDPADLRRCLLLLERVPELVEHFSDMRSENDFWDTLVEHWAELASMLEAECPGWRAGIGAAPNTYARMQELFKAVRDKEKRGQ